MAIQKMATREARQTKKPSNSRWNMTVSDSGEGADPVGDAAIMVGGVGA